MRSSSEPLSILIKIVITEYFKYVFCLQVVPLYIKTASVFYGRIVRKDDSSFDTMTAEMVCYYADKKPGATELQEGRLYAVQEDNVFHRSDLKQHI